MRDPRRIDTADRMKNPLPYEVIPGRRRNSSLRLDGPGAVQLDEAAQVPGVEVLHCPENEVAGAPARDERPVPALLRRPTHRRPPGPLCR